MMEYVMRKVYLKRSAQYMDNGQGDAGRISLEPNYASEKKDDEEGCKC